MLLSLAFRFRRFDLSSAASRARRASLVLADAWDFVFGSLAMPEADPPFLS